MEAPPQLEYVLTGSTAGSALCLRFLLRDVPGAEKPMLGFRELTLAPIDCNLIETALLDAAERDWLNAYHARVAAEIGPQLDDAGQAWLATATAPF